MEIPKKMQGWATDEYKETVQVIPFGPAIISTNETILDSLPDCRHRMGGVARRPEKRVEFSRGGVLDALEDGDSQNYSVIKHRLPTGRVMILCTRCLKEWYSADPLTGEPATLGFEEANRWPTTNAPSSSGLFFPKAVRSQSEQKVVYRFPV